jgi:cytochrome c oxidase cbb3-type subunit 3
MEYLSSTKRGTFHRQESKIFGHGKPNIPIESPSSGPLNSSGDPVRRVFLFTIFFYIAFAGTLCSQNRAQDKSVRRPPTQQAAGAKQTFENVCASCHGLDGRGGERGPNIASRPEAIHKSDQDLMRVLQGAKSASGMPSFESFGAQKLGSLVAYLRTLQGKRAPIAVPGDSKHGRLLFFGKAKCSECHSVHGEGGFYASDLSSVGAASAPEEIRRSILKPNLDLDPRRGVVTAVLNDSEALTGMPRNEDNFSLQLQTPDGSFHLLNKTEIRSITRHGVTAMPADYERSLTAAELDDLVSFLVKTVRSEDRKEKPRVLRSFEE